MRGGRHYHVHTYIPGYLCECDEHYPMSRAQADSSLRDERETMLDYAADSPADDPIRKSGSVRAGYFDWEAGIGWYRRSERWACSEAECLTLLDQD
jgi:hypothetical protein